MKLRKAWIVAAGRNYGATRMNAPIKVQQRFYKRFIQIPDEVRDQATEAGADWWNRKIVKGPGVDW